VCQRRQRPCRGGGVCPELSPVGLRHGLLQPFTIPKRFRPNPCHSGYHSQTLLANPCHSEPASAGEESALVMTTDLPQSAARSSHVGLSASNSATFFSRPPLLNFCFPSDRVVHVLKDFVVNQTVDLVSLCESFTLCGLVRQNSRHEEAGDADIQDAVLTGQNIDVVSLVSPHSRFLSRPRRASRACERFGMTMGEDW
jgi:hypothetical protein